MPKTLEKKLRRQAKKKGVRDEDAYVYGTLQKVTNWKPSHQKKRKSTKKKRKRG